MTLPDQSDPMLRDLQWAGFSFCLIYAYILASTRSFLVASAGMVRHCLSLTSHCRFLDLPLPFP